MTVDLTHLTTFRTGAKAKALITVHDNDSVHALPKQLASQDFMLMGCGSNILFADDYNGVVVLNRLRGMDVVASDSDAVSVRVAAGEIWHDVVCQLSEKGYYGLENLALIPGTVGAAPVQNIGAYGVQLSDVVESVSAFDLLEEKTQTFTHAECQFGYRDSIFKRPDYRNRYIITAVTLRLSKHFQPVVSYQNIADKLPKDFTAHDLLQGIITTRQQKLPDPAVLPNAGSFFKNAVVDAETFTALQAHYPEMPFFTVGKDNAQFKIPSAWLIEQLGFKGVTRDNGAGVYSGHALVLVNHGGAHGRDIYALACDIIDAVKKRFGIVISPEVRIISAPQR